MPLNSLTLRVSLIALVVVMVFTILTALALERAFHESAQQALQERLQAQIYLLMGISDVESDGSVRLPERLPEARLMLPGSGLYAQIRTPDEHILWRSPSSLGQALDFSERGGFKMRLTVDWEIAPGHTHPLSFLVLEDPRAFTAQIQQYRQSLRIWLGSLGFLLLLAQGLALYLGLRPLRTVAHEVQAMERGKQSELEGRYPLELRSLTDNLNNLIRHERAQIRRYRDALGDLAHSLKTPLAVLRSTLHSKDPDHALMLEHVERMDRIVAYQLQRAATSGRSVFSTPVPVAPLVQRLSNTLQKVHPGKTMVVQLDIPSDICFRGNEGDLMELLGNVLDNAWKYGHQRVLIRAAIDHDSLQLRIEDDGPGIPAAKAQAMLRRGTRLDEAIPGQGIGLAVVNDIVHAYEGQLTISRARWGGAAIILKLPGTLIPTKNA